MTRMPNDLSRMFGEPPRPTGRPRELRDEFAMHIASGWVAAHSTSNSMPVPERVADLAYSIADAMIQRRDK